MKCHNCGEDIPEQTTIPGTWEYESRIMGHMHQIPSFHKSDPETSREAIENHGNRITNAHLVLRTVKKFPDNTASELAFLLNGRLTLTEVRRRLTDLMHKNLVEQGHPVYTKFSKRREVTWRARSENRKS